MKVVAVVGASNDRRKFGNKAVRAFREAGYTVIPINPHERSVEGIPAYASVLDVPGPIDLATVYVQPERVVDLLDELQQKQIPEIWINPGAESDELLAEARARRLPLTVGCSIIGIGQRPSAY